jgi:hypothetical protein
MLEKFKNLGKVLDRTELKSINGGDVRVTCVFADGTGYELTYAGESGGNGNALKATDHCIKSGGLASVQHDV